MASNGHDKEKTDLERQDNHPRPATVRSDSSRSSNTEYNNQDVIEPVVIGEALGHIDTRRSAHRTQSRVSSTRSRALSVVPRSKRRGLFGSLTLVPEIANPPDYKSSTKWSLVFIVALATAAAPLGSTIMYREYSFVASGVSTEILYLVPPAHTP